MPKQKTKWHSMNIFLISISFICVSALHYAFFSYEVNKQEPKPIAPKYQKVSVQMATIQKPIEKPKEAQKVKKKSIKKPIKKDAKRKVVQKPKKIIKKKPVKKKTPPKKIIKKEIIKKGPKKIEKKIIKKEVAVNKEPVKKASTENKTQSLKKLKAYKQNYLTQLRAKIDSNKKYPKISKRLGEQGQVIVSFKVLKSGEFKNIKIIKSSGKKRLDKAALKALEETKSFKAIPLELNKSFLEISLPISFKLQ